MAYGIFSDDVGLSPNTMDEEDIAFLQLGAIYPANRYYAVAFFCTILWGTCSLGVVGISCYFEGDLGFAFECLHQCVVGMNMLVQVGAHNYHKAILTKIFRKIDGNYYSYGDTMDDESKKLIEIVAQAKKKRKLIFGRVFKAIIVGCVGGLCIKQPILYLIKGHGLKEVDGEKWMIFEAPVKAYVPYSDHWGPYVVGMIVAYFVSFAVGFSCSGSISCFIRFSEELLHQLFIVKVGLRNTLTRAKHTYKLRYGRDYNGTDDKDFDQCLEACMKKSVEHHLIIVELPLSPEEANKIWRKLGKEVEGEPSIPLHFSRLFADFKKLMHIPLFTVIFDGGALICLATVVVLTNDDPSVRAPMPFFMMAELYYTYVYCGYGEQLTSSFSEVGFQLYQDDWFLTNGKVIQPYLDIIRSYTFIPKQLSALGFTSPDHQTFGNILRTAYSFSNFILARD